MVLACALVSPASVSAANLVSKENVIQVFLDGKQMSFESAPKIVNGTTLVPMRAIFSSLGAEVTWDNNKRSVSAKKQGLEISISIGEKMATKNGKEIPLSTPAVIEQGTTYVPLRFVSEALGALVGWNNSTSSISISSSPFKKYYVKSATEGDTIVVTEISGETYTTLPGSNTLKLIGVAAPKSMPANSSEFYGKEASNFTQSQLTGKTVFISSDTRDSDGRSLAYVFMLDGTFYNALLVSEGYARVETVEANSKWSSYFKYAESKAIQNSNGLWNNPKRQANEEMQKYLLAKASELGFKEGEFSSGQFITRDFVARMIVTSMFPKTKYVFVANTLIDVSQQDWFSYYTSILLQEGVIKMNDLNSGKFEPNRPITYGEFKLMLSNALFGDEKTDLRLSDFNVLQDGIADGQLITMGEAIIATEKASKVQVPLKKYFDSLKKAATSSSALESLTTSLNNVDINSQVVALKAEISKVNIGSIQQKTSDIFEDFLQVLKKGSWKDIITISKIKSLISDIDRDLSKATEFLIEAKDVSN